MSGPSAARGWLVAAPRSGSGKTIVTLAIVAALRRRGVAVATAKSGPDYIDPMFHAAAMRVTPRSVTPVLPPNTMIDVAATNLDTWAMPPALLDALAARAASASELLVVESAMGLFDGVASVPGRSGAAADLAGRFALPVLLVLDVSGQSQTAAAIVRGMDSHRPGVRVGAVVLNRVGSARHGHTISSAIGALGIPVLGAIPRDANIALPERHLGLVQPGEQPDLPGLLERLAAVAERHLDLDALLAGAGTLRLNGSKEACGLPPPGQRVALAHDAAFSFVYPHLLRGWREAGAEIVPFSPLADAAPPADCDACWLPGGYPELHGGTLAAAARFRAGLASFAATRPVHGECGGYMVLGARLEDVDGVSHPMAGLLGHATTFARRRLHLGYRAATLIGDSVLGGGGTVVRGHEFHYALVEDPGDDAPLATLRDGLGHDLGPAGGRRGHVSGSFFHAIAREDTP